MGNSPQKPRPIHTALVQDKLNEYRRGPNWIPKYDQFDAARIARDLAEAGKFDDVDGNPRISYAAIDDWLVEHA